MKPKTVHELSIRLQEIAKMLKAEQARSEVALEALAPDATLAVDALVQSAARQGELLVYYRQLREEFAHLRG